MGVAGIIVITQLTVQLAPDDALKLTPLIVIAYLYVNRPTVAGTKTVNVGKVKYIVESTPTIPGITFTLLI